MPEAGQTAEQALDSPSAEQAATARATTPSLVVVCGLPGVGKTTVAERVAERLDGRVVRTDVVRKDVIEDPDYTEEESRRVYAELFARGRATVEDGTSVVLDGTFKDARNRDRAASLADDLDVPFELVKVECDRSEIQRRIESRTDDASDADFEVHEMYREQFEPLAREYVTVDNSGDVASAHEQVHEHF